MLKAAIVGATGYAGSELVRILMQHKEVEIAAVTSQSYTGKAYAEIYESYRTLTDSVLTDSSLDELAEKCDVVFLALPHGIASGVVTEAILRKTKIIDFGADFRLQSAAEYEKWYRVKHEGVSYLREAVYGLCEREREKIKKARLVANPGCYTTCSILSLAPLLAEGLIEENSVIIDAKSGVTGAGRGLSLGSMYCEANESIKAYKVASHRHTPEIEEQLSYAAGRKITVTFTPHLVPMDRGILATCYASLKAGYGYQEMKDAYEKYYREEPFIRLLKKGVFPETKWVKGSNFLDIGFTVDERTNRAIVIGAIDNLGKGAAGQAVQNMNLLFGLPETEGLMAPPIFPA